MKKWTANELRAEYGLRAEYEAMIRNMTDYERAGYLIWKRKTAPKDLKSLAEDYAEMSEQEKRDSAMATHCSMMGI